MKKTDILFITILFVAGCSSRNEQTLQCDEVNYVQEFPHEVNLEETKPLPLNLIGCVDMKPADSLLIFKMDEGEYFWKIKYDCTELLKSMGEDNKECTKKTYQ